MEEGGKITDLKGISFGSLEFEILMGNQSCEFVRVEAVGRSAKEVRMILREQLK